MRFVLFSSLQELAGSRWLQQHSLDTSSIAPRHCEDDNDQGDDDDQSPPADMSDTDADLEGFYTWAQQLQETSTLAQQLAAAGQQQPTAASLPPTPHKQLLRLAEALQQAATEAVSDSTELSTAAATLISNSVPLCKALKQLASATQGLWAAAATAATADLEAAAHASVQTRARTSAAAAAALLPLESTSPASQHVHSPQGAASPPAQLNVSAEDGTKTAPAVVTAAAAAAAAAVDVEGLKQLLFWACHLTVASHKVRLVSAHVHVSGA
jgi:hypothetical protein